jgi:regulator of protease activity HflC (stomatin/prohibitin superfamily)
MDAGLYISIAILVLAIVTVAKGVRLVPQGYKWVVQRLGKYQTTLNPGLNIIVPFIDDVSYKVTTKDIVLDIPSQEVITKDNAVIVANAVAYMNIMRFTGSRITASRSRRWCRLPCVRSSAKWRWTMPCPPAI